MFRTFIDILRWTYDVSICSRLQVKIKPLYKLCCLFSNKLDLFTALVRENAYIFICLCLLGQAYEIKIK